jgi:hypothetical protein
MTKMTYRDAQATILEPTYIGYTQVSKDKIWLIVTVDDDADPERRFKSAYGNWLFLTEHDQLSYELDDDVLVFTRRREAQEHLDSVRYAARSPMIRRIARQGHFYTLNRGDESRREDFVLGDRESAEPRFAGSKDALARFDEICASEPDGFGLKATSWQ